MKISITSFDRNKKFEHNFGEIELETFPQNDDLIRINDKTYWVDSRGLEIRGNHAHYFVSIISSEELLKLKAENQKEAQEQCQ